MQGLPPSLLSQELIQVDLQVFGRFAIYRETKRAILKQATAEGWLFLFEHDPEHCAIRVGGSEQKVTFEKVA